MGHHIIEYDRMCASCSGTGIYVGYAERDGAGIICRACHGTGCCHIRIEYDDFVKRMRRTDVMRVQSVNPGVIVGGEIAEFGGLPYDDWISGAEFIPGTEDRQHICPAWWYQCVDYELKPHWGECIGSGAFTDCGWFVCKNICWERWDQEFSQAAITAAENTQ